MKFLMLLILVSCSNVKVLKYKETPSTIKPNPEMALVYFLRAKNLAGINIVIENNKEPIGVLSSSSYFYVELPAGQHGFTYATSFRKNKSDLEIKLEKSKTYYIALNEVVTGSYPSASSTNMETTEGRFDVLTEAYAQKILPKLKEIDLEANKSFLIRK